jgi:hypothetical protein
MDDWGVGRLQLFGATDGGFVTGGDFWNQIGRFVLRQSGAPLSAAVLEAGLKRRSTWKRIGLRAMATSGDKAAR